MNVELAAYPRVSARNLGIFAFLACATILLCGCAPSLTITKVPVFSESSFKCESHETVWETSGENCTATITVQGSAECNCLVQGDEEHLSNGNANTSRKTGLSANVECRRKGDASKDCSYRVTGVQCSAGAATVYGPADKHADAGVADTATHLDCGKNRKLYEGTAAAVTVLMIGDEKCSAEVWGGWGAADGPGGTSGKSALAVSTGRRLVTFQKPTVLYGWCHGDGGKGCDFQVVAVENKTP